MSEILFGTHKDLMIFKLPLMLKIIIPVERNFYI